MKKSIIFIVAVIVMAAGAASADLYTWEDESGTAHVTDYPPPQTLTKSKVTIYEEGAPGEKPAVQQPKKPDITLYTKDNCPVCDRARNYLNSRELTFTEYNMDTNWAAAEKRRKIDDGTDVPFAVIDKKEVTGFSESVYNRLLKPAP